MLRRVLALWTALVCAGSGPDAGVAAAWRLVIVDGADPARGYVQTVHAEVARTTLIWPHGAITVPDSVVWQIRAADLEIGLEPAELRITAAAGTLPVADGNFDIDTPLLVEDGRLVALLAAGRLRIEGERLMYRRPPSSSIPGRQGTLLLVAGLAVATAVLLRAARRRTRSV